MDRDFIQQHIEVRESDGAVVYESMLERVQGLDLDLLLQCVGDHADETDEEEPILWGRVWRDYDSVAGTNMADY